MKRRCVACGKRLPLEAFYRDRKGKDGLAYACMVCMRARNLAHYHSHTLRKKRVLRAKSTQRCKLRAELEHVAVKAGAESERMHRLRNRGKALEAQMKLAKESVT